MRIIFMGTPDFAVPSLQFLVEKKFNVVAVITAPDKPSGRGKKINESPVKKAAKDLNLPILQPTKLKDPQFIETLKRYKADMQIVVAFRMLPEIVWNMPPKGTYNLHGSLLPQYRGAAPIHWAIINGEKETGVTTFKLVHEIDKGSILFQEKENIDEEDTTGTVYERLMIKGAHLVIKSVTQIESGNYTLKPQQDHRSLKHAPKIFPKDCEIDWSKTQDELYNFVRGLNPRPGAWTTVLGFKTKISITKKVASSNSILPGKFRTDNKTYLEIQTGKGALSILELQKEGKRKMLIKDFLAGNII